MKKTSYFLASIIVSTLSPAVIAEETQYTASPHIGHPHQQFAYQQSIPVPRDSTPFPITNEIVELCKDPYAEAIIKQFERGEITLKSAKSDLSVPPSERMCLTYDEKGQYKESRNCDSKDTLDGVYWKVLMNNPQAIGAMGISGGEWKPHYHAQPECYYIIKGKAKILIQNKYQDIKKGQYNYFPGNAIHGFVVEENEGTFEALYWWPKNANASGFHYYWKNSVTNMRVAEEAFDRVDAIRKRDLGLPPVEYGPPIDSNSGK